MFYFIEAKNMAFTSQCLTTSKVSGMDMIEESNSLFHRPLLAPHGPALFTL